MDLGHVSWNEVALELTCFYWNTNIYLSVLLRQELIRGKSKTAVSELVYSLFFKYI